MSIFHRTGKPWLKELQRLKERLALLPENDPLWDLLLDLIGQFIVAETNVAVAANLGDVEAHYRRGRVAMLLDFHRELEHLLLEARKEAERFRRG